MAHKHESLIRVAEHLHYTPDQIAKILSSLSDDDGSTIRASSSPISEVVANGGFVITCAQASADHKRRPLVQTAMAMARRAGYHHTDLNKPIDVVELDRALAGRSVDERMRIKSALYDLRLIPA